MNISTDPRKSFAEAVFRDMGASIDPLADGTLHRFDDPEGKRNNKACWYVLHLDGRPAGVYGNWRTGEQRTWLDRQQASFSDRPSTVAVIEKARQRREKDLANAHALAADRAARIWADAEPLSQGHPYLTKKRISGSNLRRSGELVAVPLRDTSGRLQNLQLIWPDGSKRFLKGGRVKGCFWSTGGGIDPSGQLYIAEGMATGATIAATIGSPVIAAMNAGNLLPVARDLRLKYPDLKLVIAADNDHRTKGNPGMAKAAAAARLCKASLTWPTVCGENDCCCTDFNDVALCERCDR